MDKDWKEDESWLTLFLLLSYAFQKDPDFLHKINEKYEQERKDREYMNNCDAIEWEQDMGKSIPFCKLDGQLCNMQCMKRC